MKKFKIEGVITAIVTPFKRNTSIDYEAFDRLLDFQIENKVNGIVVCGTTGESATLSVKEKTALITHAVEYSAGRIPIIAATGSNETEATKDMTLVAKEHGADAALIVTPYYNKPTQEGLYHHYRITAETVNLPIILYNVPSRTGVNMSAETQLRLAVDCKNVVGVKEASGDLTQLMHLIKFAPSGFTVLAGDDGLTLSSIALGAKGVVSVISNYAPKLFADCVNSALKGKYDEARKIHYQLLELMELNFIESNPIPVKYAVSAMGLCGETVRLPLSPLKQDYKKLFKTAMKAAGVIS